MKTVCQRKLSKQPQLWLNPDFTSINSVDAVSDIGIADVKEAESRLAKFAPLLESIFPELIKSHGIIESDLLSIPGVMGIDNTDHRYGSFWIKADHALPVAGSIKARGGIHEILEFAQLLATQHQLMKSNESVLALLSPAAQALFGKYEISVGSTGNLGLSVGIMSAALGFRATVHMSINAKDWKKERLRERGVKVVEYASDYAEAVAAGRVLAENNPYSYFVDDEKSLSLFLGYSVAALRLQGQFKDNNILVDAQHPLFVYLPCGIGGAPGGVSFGLKKVFGDHVHCFFIEPTTSASFLAQMQNPDWVGITVHDVGLDNRTQADGLAVPGASVLAIREMRSLLSGIVTTTDDTMFSDLYWLHAQENIKVEPSAAAAVSGPRMLLGMDAGQDYLSKHALQAYMHQANHIIWTTGGLFMPDDEHAQFLEYGKSVIEKSKEIE